jgi:hypothetical protein
MLSPTFTWGCVTADLHSMHRKPARAPHSIRYYLFVAADARLLRINAFQRFSSGRISHLSNQRTLKGEETHVSYSIYLDRERAAENE